MNDCQDSNSISDQADNNSIRTPKIENDDDGFDLQGNKRPQVVIDALQEYKNLKLKKICSMMPIARYKTGPQGFSFSLYEDMLILICANPFTRRSFLNGKRGRMYASGSSLTILFWQKIIMIFNIQRSPEALRSRFTRILSELHPKEYDQFIELLEQKDFFSLVKYGRHFKKFNFIRRVITEAQQEQQRQLKQIKHREPKKDRVQRLFLETFNNAANNQWNGFQQKQKLKYLTDEYYEEKNTILHIANDVQSHNDQKYRNLIFDWIKSNTSTLQDIQSKLKQELNEVNDHIQYCDLLKKWVSDLIKI